MRGRILSLLLAGLSAGCWLSAPRVGADTIVSCASEADCPSGFTCVVAAGRCAPEDNADRFPPAVTFASVGAVDGFSTGGPGRRMSWVAEFNEDLAPGERFFFTLPAGSEPREVELPAGDVDPFNGPRLFAGEVTLPEIIAEGEANLRVTARDDFGNALDGEVLFTFEIDASAPEIIASSVDFTPGEGNLLTNPDAATVGTRVQVFVAFNELADPRDQRPMMAVGSLRADGFDACTGAGALELDGEHDGIAGDYTLTIAAPASDDTLSLFLCVRDPAGNQQSVRLEDTVDLRVSRPRLTVKQDQVVVVRAERGNSVEEARGDIVVPAGAFLALAPPDTLNDARIAGDTFVLEGGELPTTLLVWSDRTRQLLMASLQPGALDGGLEAPAAVEDAFWPRTTTSLNTLATVYVSALDAAGNESELIALDRAERVIVPGATAVGAPPHRVVTGAESGGLTNASPRTGENNLDQSAAAAASGLGDGAALRSAVGPAWRTLLASNSASSTLPLRGFLGRFTFDAARARVVLTGDERGSIFEWDGRAWRTIQLPQAGQLPEGAIPVFDEREGATLIIAANGTERDVVRGTFRWDGETVRLVTEDTPVFNSPQAINAPALGGTLLYSMANLGEVHLYRDGKWRLLTADAPPLGFLSGAYDPVGERVVFFGGTTDYQEGLSQTWIFDGASFTQLEDAGGPPIAVGGAMAFDPRTNEVILIGPPELGNGTLTPSNATFAFDGTRWRDLGLEVPSEPQALRTATWDAANEQLLVASGTSFVSINPIPGGVAPTIATPSVFQPLFALDRELGWRDPLVQSNVPPALPQGSAVAIDPVREVIVGFSGAGGGQITAEVDLTTHEFAVVAEPPPPPPPPPPVCGDGIVNRGEHCDFGDDLPGDGCDESCRLENPSVAFFDDIENPVGWETPEGVNGRIELSLARASSPVQSWFGSGALVGQNGPNELRLISPPIDVPAEQIVVLQFEHFFHFDDCDDPQFTPDGVRVDVELDEGFGPILEPLQPPGGYPDFIESGGNGGFGHDSGGVFRSETFDLAFFAGRQVRFHFVMNLDEGDCQTEEGWYLDDVAVLSGAAGPPPPGCGNAKVEVGEQCDDGNTDALDGCDDACQLESPTVVFEDDIEDPIEDGWTSSTETGEPSFWAPSTTRASSPVQSWQMSGFIDGGFDQLESPPLDLPAGSAILLEFSHFFDFVDCGFPEATTGGLLVIDEGGGFAPLIEPVAGYPAVSTFGLPTWAGSSGGFQPEAVDLTPFAGKTVRIGWAGVHLEQGCGGAEGWYIDDVRVLAAPLTGGGGGDPEPEPEPEVVLPPPRNQGAMAYSIEEGGVVLFGGVDPFSGGLLNDTWLWDGLQWTELCVSDCTPPPARIFGGMVTDAAGDGVLIHGGTQLELNEFGQPVGQIDLGDTWRFSGGQWTQLNVGGDEVKVREHILAQHVSKDRLVALGGLRQEDSGPVAVPSVLLRAGGWAEVTPAARPQGVFRPGAVFHPTLDQILVFGGSNGDTVFNETFLLDVIGDQIEFKRLSPGGVPPLGRRAGNLYYDEADDEVHLVGGLDAQQQLFIDHAVLGGIEDRAVASFRVDLRAEGLDPRLIDAVVVRGRAAGSAEGADGFALEVFDGAGFVTLVENDAAPAGGTAPAAGEFQVELDLDNIATAPLLSLRVTSRAGGRSSFGQDAEVVLDYLEVRVGHVPSRPLVAGEACDPANPSRFCGFGTACRDLGDGNPVCVAQVQLEAGDACVDGDPSEVCGAAAGLGCVDGSCQQVLTGESPAWTCATDRFADGRTCDCGCGVRDPDCEGPDRGQCTNCTLFGSCVVNPDSQASDRFGCRLIAEDDNARCIAE